MGVCLEFGVLVVLLVHDLVQYVTAHLCDAMSVVKCGLTFLGPECVGVSESVVAWVLFWRVVGFWTKLC